MTETNNPEDYVEPPVINTGEEKKVPSPLIGVAGKQGKKTGEGRHQSAQNLTEEGAPVPGPETRVQIRDAFKKGFVESVRGEEEKEDK